MAKVERIEFFDDLDGKLIEPDDLNRVEFEVKLPGRRAARYSLDLRSTSLAKFERDIGKYIAKANRAPDTGTPVATRSRKSTSTNGRGRTREIRNWARENGYEVSQQGRLAHEIVAAFEAES